MSYASVHVLSKMGVVVPLHSERVPGRCSWMARRGLVGTCSDISKEENELVMLDGPGGL